MICPVKRLCVATLLALAFTSPAYSAQPPEGWGAAEYAIAQQYWNTPTTCDTMEVQFDAPVRDEVGVIAEGQNWLGHCFMRIKAGLEILVQCQAVVHEYGHILGLEHSADERSVMYPLVSRYNIPSLCVRLLDRYRPGQSRKALKRL